MHGEDRDGSDAFVRDQESQSGVTIAVVATGEKGSGAVGRVVVAVVAVAFAE